MPVDFPGVCERRSNRDLRHYKVSFPGGSCKPTPTTAALGVDTNGDGAVEMGLTSPDWSMARNEQIIFRLGERFVSFQEIDLATGRVLFRPHGASEYLRIELTHQ